MNQSEFLVILISISLLAFLYWFFFGPRRSTHTENVGARQSITVTVKGGYSPNTIEAVSSSAILAMQKLIMIR